MSLILPQQRPLKEVLAWLRELEEPKFKNLWGLFRSDYPYLI